MAEERIAFERTSLDEDGGPERMSTRRKLESQDVVEIR